VICVPIAFDLVQLNALCAVAGPYGGCKMMLFKNDILPNKQTVLDDLITCDFDGYADSAALVWGQSHYDISGNAVATAPLVTFTSTGMTKPNTVYGWALKDGGGATLLRTRRFDEPVAMTELNQVMQVLPLINLGEPIDLNATGVR